ncbi:unnamed protein product [Heterobilharzia americana]|nr:unnamed protein product [Heterobilharzia americana]
MSEISVSTDEVFNTFINNMLNSSKTIEIIHHQDIMLNKFEKTNEMLRTVTELSETRYRILFTEFTEHIKTIILLKKDIDNIFKRIQFIKKLLSIHYPNDMHNVNEQFSSKYCQQKDEINDNSIERSCQQTDIVIPPIKTMETVHEDLSFE